MSTARHKPTVLCVDDEPAVLHGLQLHMRKAYKVTTATSGAQALDIIRNSPEPFDILISDMRMPEMTGAVLLKKARELSPSTVRILLTGHTDIESAIAAINEGQIFRFLTKPCHPDTLLEALDAARTQGLPLHPPREAN